MRLILLTLEILHLVPQLILVIRSLYRAIYLTMIKRLSSKTAMKHLIFQILARSRTDLINNVNYLN